MVRWLVACVALVLAMPAGAGDLYSFPRDAQSRWASPENPLGEKGQGAITNQGAKGRAFVSIPAGQAVVLADVKGSGIIDRIWLTIQDPAPELLRGLRIDMYWEGAAAPAVSAPLGDFFGQNGGEMVRLDTELLASPEARSFVAYFPMPFRKAARVVVTNESGADVPLFFYDVDYRLQPVADDALYFHAWWHRERATKLGRDFELLPAVTGRGRFLGASVIVQSNPAYGKTWWGEGEVKIWLDGDRDHPTLAGTGTEDYVGSAWGLGAYTARYQGAPVADEVTGRWSFYRFHVPDPVWFSSGARVTLQQIGGAMKADVIKLQAAGVPLWPVSISGLRFGLIPLMGQTKPLKDQPDGWTNFYRSDDVAAVAWFYLDAPENGLPPLAPAAERAADLRRPASK